MRLSMSLNVFATLVALALISVFPQVASAQLQAPHNVLVCDDCHSLHNGSGAAGSNYATVNNMCLSCHDGSGSSLIADSHDSNSYGATTACNQCHNAHVQQHPSYGKLLKAVINGVTVQQVTASTGPWVAGAGAQTGICEVCHTQTGNHSTANDTDHYNSDYCMDTCHLHDDGDGAFGFSLDPSAGDCIGCHAGNGNANARPLNTTSGDFSAGGSHHVQRNFATAGLELSIYDCVICHLEGDEFGALDGTYHKKDMVINLRDLDDAGNTAWTYTDDDVVNVTTGPNAKADVTTLTKFCLRCHDATGPSSGWVSTVNGNDANVSRSASNPFGDGNSPLDINSKFDPSLTSTHSISNWWDSGGAADCSSNPCAGTEYNDPLNSGACTTKEADDCNNMEQFSNANGTSVCSCAMQYDDTGTNNGACTGCVSAEYSGGDCLTFTDPCPSQMGGSCAAGRGACINGTPSVSEQITMSDFYVTTTNDWSYTADGAADQGDASQAEALQSGGAGTSVSFSITTQAPSATYSVWVNAAHLGTKGGAPVIGANINGAIGTASVGSANYQWFNLGSKALTANTYTVTISCTGDGKRTCMYDGFIITTETIDPTGWANYDSATYDFYNFTPAGWSCSCNTGYTGTGCLSCDAGNSYFKEGDQCVNTSACDSVTCLNGGTCYIDDTDNTVVALCDCPGTYFHDLALCDGCSAGAGGGWASGNNPSYCQTDGVTNSVIKTAAFANGWSDATPGTPITTECADCHMPGDPTGSLAAGKTYSNNAHGSYNTLYLLDSANGLDEVLDDSTAAGSTANCYRCHDETTYQGGTANSRNPEHGRGAHQALNWSTWATELNLHCMNCHGGSSWASAANGAGIMNDRGTIHGFQGTVYDHTSANNHPAFAFVNGTALDGFTYDANAGNCSTVNNTTGTFRTFACANHEGWASRSWSSGRY